MNEERVRRWLRQSEKSTETCSKSALNSITMSFGSATPKAILYFATIAREVLNNEAMAQRADDLVRAVLMAGTGGLTRSEQVCTRNVTQFSHCHGHPLAQEADTLVRMMATQLRSVDASDTTGRTCGVVRRSATRLANRARIGWNVWHSLRIPEPTQISWVLTRTAAMAENFRAMATVHRHKT